MQTGAPAAATVRTRASTAAIPVDVLLDRGLARPSRSRAELPLAPVVEPEQLVGVAVLLVVVDQARIRRRGDDAVVRPAQLELPRVPVEHERSPARIAHLGEGSNPAAVSVR